MSASRKRYLFIRLLEACTADCFMCDYALSRDRYRFSLAEFEGLLPEARDLGVGFVRFTGGEPLLHKGVLDLIRAGVRAGMKMSLITNGHLLPRMIDALSQAGLCQVIVSIDGAAAASHDSYRNTPGLFDKCVAGLQLARERGLLTRVNTVVGPHNFEEMPLLQRRLTGIGVQQWELSAIKLERPVAYPAPDRVRAVCDPIYEADFRSILVPMGKRFYGDTAAEQTRYFDTGITPRAGAPVCNLVGDVIYVDARAGRGYGCSLLPHRSAEASGGGVEMRTGSGWRLGSDRFAEHVAYFRSAGPTLCQGCSTTAAGYSDDVARRGSVADWHF